MNMDTESSILTRIIDPGKGTLPEDLARYVLQLNFSPADHERVEELSAKAQQGTLTAEEEVQLDRYLHVNDFLMIMQSKARRSLAGNEKE